MNNPSVFFGKWKKRAMFPIAALLFFSMNGCGKQDNRQAPSPKTSHRVTDLAGRIVEVPVNIERVSCVDVLAFQSLLILGEADKISEMRLTWAPWMYQVNPKLKNIPKITGVSVEELLKKRIDVVFTYNDPKELATLASAGIAAVVAQPPTIESLDGFIASQKEMVRLYGKIMGDKAVEKAEAWCSYYDDKIGLVTSRTQGIPKEKRTRVYIIRGPDALSTHGRTGYMTWYGEMAGADMLVKNSPNTGGKTQVSMEEIIAWDPEVIFIGRQYSHDLVFKDNRWRNITAVKEKKVHSRPDGVFYWDGGTETVLLMLYMARTLYPELFRDLDMSLELKEYYRRFYKYTLSDDEARKILAGESPDGSHENHFNN
ncbi:MAG: ABC transporter substrate-binding protein [Fibrobacterota bacterium]